MRNWKSTLFSILIALTLSCLGLGTSLWNVDSNVNPNTQKSFPLASNSNNKVAYFKDSKGATRSFTTIEGALNAAGKGNETNFANTIYVIPGTNPTINTECTIASKDTLCIPYEGETYNGRQRNAEKGGTSNNSWKTPVQYTNRKISSGDYIANGSNPFADSNADYVAYFKKNEVTLNSKLIISSGACLQIGGILGWKDIGVTGQTSGKYCQITRGKGASIENSGTIDCRGYIKETNSAIETTILNKSGSVRKRPFVFYDYKGGKYTAAAYGGETKIFPLSRYDFPNIQSQLTFKHTSKLIGYVDLFTGTTTQTVTKLGVTATATIAARHNVDDLNVIGPGGEDKSYLFETLDSSASFVFKRKLKETRYTSFNASEHSPNYVTDFKINGNCKFNATSISIQAGDDVTAETGKIDISIFLNSVKKKLNQTIETSSVDFPLPWNFHVSVMDKGSLEINNSLKLMPGARLMVSSGASLKINGKVVIYDKSLGSALFVDPGRIESQKLSTDYIYPNNKGEAKLINNGTRTIVSGASFGGKVSSEKEKATIFVNDGANLTGVSCHEGIGTFSIDGLDIIFQFYEYPDCPVTKSACGARIRKYYKTDIAPSYVYENGIEQLLVAGESYSSCSSTSDTKTFGWYRKNGRNDKHGIKIVLDPKSEFSSDAEISNPNAGDIFVDYLTNKIMVLEALSDPSGKKLFKGFSYDSLGTDRLDGNGFTLNIDKAINKLVNGIVTVYANWNDAEMPVAKVRTAYYEGNDLVTPDSYSSVDAGVALSLGNLTSRDREGGTDKDNFKVTYDNVDWLVKDETDGTETHVAPGSSFVPQEKHSYTIEPIYKTHYFLRINVTNKKYKAGLLTYYAIKEIKIKDKSSDLKQDNEDTHTAWIESTDKLTIQIRLIGNPGGIIEIPGYQPITIGKNETKNINFTTDKDPNNKPLLDVFINRTGPINVKGTVDGKA